MGMTSKQSSRQIAEESTSPALLPRARVNTWLKNSYKLVFIFRSGKTLVLPTMQRAVCSSYVWTMNCSDALWFSDIMNGSVTKLCSGIMVCVCWNIGGLLITVSVDIWGVLSRSVSVDILGVFLSLSVSADILGSSYHGLCLLTFSGSYHGLCLLTFWGFLITVCVCRHFGGLLITVCVCWHFWVFLSQPVSVDILGVLPRSVSVDILGSSYHYLCLLTFWGSSYYCLCLLTFWGLLITACVCWHFGVFLSRSVSVDILGSSYHGLCLLTFWGSSYHDLRL